MSTTRWYDENSFVMTRALEMEIERLESQTRMGWAKEARVLQLLGLRDGMKVLELGSGPGFITERLATLVPNGSITSVENSPPMIEYARKYLETRVACKYELLPVSAAELPLEANTFDFVLARLLLQHVPDPDVVCREALRVLKPGGRLVVADLEHDLATVSDPMVPQYKVLHEKSIAINKAMGSDVYIGRKLWRLLKRTGFVELDIELVALHSGYRDIREFSPQLNADIGIPLVRAGLLDQESLDILRQEIDAFMKAEDPFLLRTLVVVGGAKTV
jgi:ubiquinone/menaquinone biosynthesis C-methylase UbiE